MTKGKVKFFDRKKGFGFIATDEGADVYVNINDVETGPLSDGDQVEFEVEERDKGPRAIKVKKVE